MMITRFLTSDLEDDASISSLSPQLLLYEAARIRAASTPPRSIPPLPPIPLPPSLDVTYATTSSPLPSWTVSTPTSPMHSVSAPSHNFICLGNNLCPSNYHFCSSIFDFHKCRCLIVMNFLFVCYPLEPPFPIISISSW